MKQTVLLLIVMVAVILLVLLVTPSVNASAPLPAEYVVDWHTVDGGGATSMSTSPAYSLTGTIGQPDAGRLAGTGLVLHGGYWNTALGDLLRLFLPFVRR